MLDKNIKHQIDKLFTDLAKPDMPGCIVSVIKDGKVLYKNSYGMANLELDVPVSENTVFNIGSISKQFTAASIALLEESGELSLEDNIREYIPQLPDYCSKITIADLVYMTNGIRDFYHTTQYLMGVVEDDFVSAEEALKLLCSIKDPIFEAGEQWTYGNSGYFLLSEIIKRVTGKNLAQFAKDNIFEPLGMKNTLFRDDRSKIIKNRAQGYCKYSYLHPQQQDDTNNDVLCINVDNYDLTGPGQVWTTIGDLYLWDQNFYTNKLGKENQEMISKLTNSGKLKNGQDCGYGYGLFLGERNGRKHVYHGGSTAGFLSMYYRIPSENFSVIWLSNSNYSYYQLAEKFGMSVDKYISDLVLEGKLMVQPKQQDNILKEEESGVNIKESQLQKFVGSYQCPQTASVWEIRYQDNKLLVDENRDYQFEIKAKESHCFVSKDGSTECMFKESQNSYEIYVTREAAQYKFTPFIGHLTTQQLSEYDGEYYCDQLNTTFIVNVDKERLYIKNKDRHRKGVDFHYSPSIKDHFINFNNYTGSMMITFNRDNDGNIKSFVFRDYDGDKRELLEFDKVK